MIKRKHQQVNPKEAALAKKMREAAGDNEKAESVIKEWVDEGLHMPAPIGPVIREARKNKGMTQKELADAVGVTAATIQKYEAGIVKNVPWLQLMLIQQKLEIPAEKFGFQTGTTPKSDAAIVFELSKLADKYFKIFNYKWVFLNGNILLADMSQFSEEDVITITGALAVASSHKKGSSK